MNSQRNSDSNPDASSGTTANQRDAIDQLDRQILELVQRRQRIVRELCVDGRGTDGRGTDGRGKLVGHVADATARIDSLLRSERTPEGETRAERVPHSSGAALLKHVSSICLQSIHQLQTIYLGPQHSYSHLAAIKYFGDATTLTPVASIPAVFEAVAREDALSGIVPIENSTDGRIVDTLGMFIQGDMQICGEVLLPIHHNLLSRTPRDEITEVHSKPQALSQCRGWLAKQLPKARLVEISSTAAAAKLASEQTGVAAVASLEAGREYELDVIAASIEDNPNNITRFAVLGRERPSPTGNDKTAILFQVSHEPGALANAMTVFKQQNLNLTWIESFPAPDTKNEYMFFIELSGHRDTAEVHTSINQLQQLAQRLTILGSYPRATID
jgi:chorismate mutase/prephenate dehydratase